VLLACQGQLRLAPGGRVVGIDMPAALQLAAARGYDIALLSELLPAAEAGLIEALQANSQS
jgi:ABC-type amino acid transport substrate-binding protein